MAAARLDLHDNIVNIVIISDQRQAAKYTTKYMFICREDIEMARILSAIVTKTSRLPDKLEIFKANRHSSESDRA